MNSNPWNNPSRSPSLPATFQPAHSGRFFFARRCRHRPAPLQPFISVQPAPQTPVIAAIALGSNLGDRELHLSTAISYMGVLPTTRVIATSSIFETAPVGPQDQGHFLNMAVALQTTLPPRDLLRALLAIETAQGRVRSQRWGPRTLDLDILLYGDTIVSEPGLSIPHPHLAQRRFVLEPLAEILPHAIIPSLGITVSQTLSLLPPDPAR